MRRIPFGLILIVGLQSTFGEGTRAAGSCDELIGHLITRAVKPAVDGFDCGVLKKAGVDKNDHHLNSVCYTSTGPVSRVEVQATFTCKTSDKALIHFSTSANATAVAEVRGSDCSVSFVDFQVSGEIAKVLVDAFDLKGRLADALKKGLAGAC
jgi:hypothetical protein